MSEELTRIAKEIERVSIDEEAETPAYSDKGHARQLARVIRDLAAHIAENYVEPRR